MSEEKIVAKVQKLLSLANSDNEHEAKLAAQRANELLIKHNLKLQDVQDAKLDYKEHEVESGMRSVQGYQKMICTLMGEYFFVRPVVCQTPDGEVEVYTGRRWSIRRTFTRRMLFLGRSENVKIASYVYSFLCRTYPKLWEDYRNKNGAPPSARNSYYLGLTSGIGKMLREARFRVQEETGLVLVGDKNLEEFAHSRTGGKGYGDMNLNNIESQVYGQGVQDGMKVRLRKGIESESVKSGTTLEHKP